MPIAEITQALSSLKLALDIGKAINQSGTAIEMASLRLQLADLMGALADAKISVVGAADAAAEKDAEIARLLAALENKQKVAKKWDAYYELDEQGRPFGEPYCMHCWEQDHRLAHLSRTGRYSEPSKCTRCRNSFAGRRTPYVSYDGSDGTTDQGG